MKRLIISEEEKNHILGLHKSKLLKENTNPPVQSLTPTQKLEKIQQALNLTADAIIGKDTTRAIEDKLSGLQKQDGKTKYACVVNHNHVKINDTGTDKLEYQIGDLVFSLDGTYIDLNPNTGEKFIYSCDGDIISTSKHAYIRKDMYPVGSEEYKEFSQEPTQQQTKQEVPQQVTQQVQTQKVDTTMRTQQSQTSQPVSDVGTLSRKEERKLKREKEREERQRKKQERQIRNQK
jgi:hypothetical protein